MPLVLTYSKFLPDVRTILRKYQVTLRKSERMREVFGKPPLQLISNTCIIFVQSVQWVRWSLVVMITDQGSVTTRYLITWIDRTPRRSVRICTKAGTWHSFQVRRPWTSLADRTSTWSKHYGGDGQGNREGRWRRGRGGVGGRRKGGERRDRGDKNVNIGS